MFRRSVTEVECKGVGTANGGSGQKDKWTAYEAMIDKRMAATNCELCPAFFCKGTQAEKDDYAKEVANKTMPVCDSKADTKTTCADIFGNHVIMKMYVPCYSKILASCNKHGMGDTDANVVARGKIEGPCSFDKAKNQWAANGCDAKSGTTWAALAAESGWTRDFGSGSVWNIGFSMLIALMLVFFK